MTLNLKPASELESALKQAGKAQSISGWQQNDAAGISAKCLGGAAK